MAFSASFRRQDLQQRSGLTSSNSGIPYTPMARIPLYAFRNHKTYCREKPVRVLCRCFTGPGAGLARGPSAAAPACPCAVGHRGGAAAPGWATGWPAGAC